MVLIFVLSELRTCSACCDVFSSFRSSSDRHANRLALSQQSTVVGYRLQTLEKFGISGPRDGGTD